MRDVIPEIMEFSEHVNMSFLFSNVFKRKGLTAENILIDQTEPRKKAGTILTRCRLVTNRCSNLMDFVLLCGDICHLVLINPIKYLSRKTGLLVIFKRKI